MHGGSPHACCGIHMQAAASVQARLLFARGGGGNAWSAGVHGMEVRVRARGRGEAVEWEGSSGVAGGQGREGGCEEGGMGEKRMGGCGIGRDRVHEIRKVCV